MGHCKSSHVRVCLKQTSDLKPCVQLQQQRRLWAVWLVIRSNGPEFIGASVWNANPHSYTASSGLTKGWRCGFAQSNPEMRGASLLQIRSNMVRVNKGWGGGGVAAATVILCLNAYSAHIRKDTELSGGDNEQCGRWAFSCQLSGKLEIQGEVRAAISPTLNECMDHMHSRTHPYLMSRQVSRQPSICRGYLLGVKRMKELNLTWAYCQFGLVVSFLRGRGSPR